LNFEELFIIFFALADNNRNLAMKEVLPIEELLIT